MNHTIKRLQNDGVVRVFSADISRQASVEELAAYEEQISNFEAKSAQQIGGIKISELPGEEALLEKGVKDGQTRIIKVENKVMAYNWSIAENKWNLIGNVTGSAENNDEKPKFKGKEYDYVFDVDIEPGKPMLKLPYNKKDDPWQAAQKFIHDNQLSQNFLDEVANFIIKNSNSSDDMPKRNATEYVDPFTGEARYIPGLFSTDERSRNRDTNSFAEMPRYQSKTSVVLSSCYFPQREFLRFDQANMNLILEKLLEFNKKSRNENFILNDSQIENLVKTCETGACCRMEDIETLNRLLEWPEEMVFPVLDVMRLAIRNTEANNLLCNDRLIPRLMNYLSPNSRITSNTMLALRVLVNMISGDAGLMLANKNILKLLNIIESIPAPHSKPVQVAMSTLLLNVSVLLRRSDTSDGRAEALSVTKHVLLKFTDQEALFRTLVALGTLLIDFVDTKNYSSSFKAILIKHQNDSSYESKIQQCCQHILQVLL